MNWNDVPHRRFNPLTGETILVSPHRTKRPWQGKVEAIPQVAGLKHDPNCYLCPGNKRAGDAVNPQYQELGARSDINHVQIFENRGEIMGCSNPHPHGQIWAQRTVPDLPAKEGENQEKWLKEKGTVLLMDYLALEHQEKERILFENDTWVALVPYWAVWPYETMLLPKAHRRDLTELTAAEQAGLADALGRMTRRFDNLFQVSFPYSMGVHQRPTDGKAHDGWQLHLHFLPPLLRSATVKKFMVGYELAAQPQRDITAEQAAEKLRACGEEVLK